MYVGTFWVSFITIANAYKTFLLFPVHIIIYPIPSLRSVLLETPDYH